MANRLARAISVFDPSTHYWHSLPLSLSPRPSSTIRSAPTRSSYTKESRVNRILSLVSWNIDAFSARRNIRAQSILECIVKTPKAPDVIFLQEVTLESRDFLLRNVSVRNDYLTIDAKDGASFEGVPFATMTLLSKQLFHPGLFSKADDVIRKTEQLKGEKFELGSITRVRLPSIYGRDALCVDIIPPGSLTSIIRLINVHLDSLPNGFANRVKQLRILTHALREPGCDGGLIAGDFNAISPADHDILHENGLEDAWLASGGEEGATGATWSVGVKRQDGLEPKRLDKVATMGLKAVEMEILRPGFIDRPIPGGSFSSIPWSDHCGLKCTLSF